MTTFITFKSSIDKTPHYCDRKYGEAVADRFYYMKDWGFLRFVPFWSLLRGFVNSFSVPEDDVYLCNGVAELFPVYYKTKRSDIITLVKEQIFWDLPQMSESRRKFILKVLSINKGFITDTERLRAMIKKYCNIKVEVCSPFCAQPFLENRPQINAKSIVFVGAHSPNKGYGQLLEAFKIIKKTDTEWELYMIGSCARNITEQIDGVHVLGYVRDIRPYMSKCSIYVHPAYFEPFGITVLEAMSGGVIPIVTKATGSSEVLEKNSLPFLIVEDNKPETLAQKIVEVYNYSTAKKKKISAKCKSIVKKGYLEEKGVKQFRRAFDIIMDN